MLTLLETKIFTVNTETNNGDETRMDGAMLPSGCAFIVYRLYKECFP
jgi:hypothetical protein